MTYNERIDICKKLLSDVRDVISDNEGKEELSRVLAGLSEYVEGQAFLENTDEEKALDSWNILLNTIEHCHEYVDGITDRLFPIHQNTSPRMRLMEGSLRSTPRLLKKEMRLLRA